MEVGRERERLGRKEGGGGLIGPISISLPLFGQEKKKNRRQTQ